ncbi:CotH kinase family protein [Nocardioidaceae bacterium SCSIO 66511]|nr:CotH kinase family protein [Nocardioidaceae bacterium SCSIO 66511]
MSLRQHWKPVAAFAVLVALLVGWFGDARVRPYVTGDVTTVSSTITENIAGTTDLFDDGSHEVHIDIDDEAYDDMIDTYLETGEKDWVPADVTIDDTVISDVAVRLKGNSTLRGLDGSGANMPEDMPEDMPQGELPENLPQGGPSQDQSGTPGNGLDRTKGGDNEDPGGASSEPNQGMAGMMNSDLSSDDPETLPLLISFSEYEEGRAYQGMTQLSVRPVMGDSPMLNEAVSLDLTADSGQPSQQYAYTRYSVNDSPTTTRLVLEVPDEPYATEDLGGNGVLYKVTATSDFSYHGDDQTDYTEDFTQISQLGTQDLGPVIKLLKWLDTANDEEFDRDLDEYVDVESLAQYTASQNLLLNFDDIAGPGRNGYLWYDLDTKKFSIVSWDLNLALSGDTSTQADDELSMGGGMPGGNGGNGGNSTGQGDEPPEGMPDQGDLPEGMPDQGDLPEGMPDQGDLPEGGARMGNTLKERFLDSDAYADEYHDAYRQVAEDMFSGNNAVATLQEIADSVPTSDTFDENAIDDAVASLTKALKARAKAVAKDPVVSTAPKRRAGDKQATES